MHNIDENFLLRKENLKDGIINSLKAIPVSIQENKSGITVNFYELLICGVDVEEDGYKIYNCSKAWKNHTTYLCEDAGDETWLYYVESIDECIGEVQRLVMFEAKKGKTSVATDSELRRHVTADKFEKAFREFIEQADKNVISKKSQGSKKPLGYESGNIFDGGNLSQHFGQGAASKTPYLNWWVVSIYYLTDSGNIIIGIEADRYPHLHKMKPLRNELIGNKKVNVAVFYSVSKNSVNYNSLYDKFIEISEVVMKLGLR